MTDPGWQAGQPNGSTRWSGHGRSGPADRNTLTNEPASGPGAEQRSLDLARARYLRRKLHDAARQRVAPRRPPVDDELIDEAAPGPHVPVRNAPPRSAKKAKRKLALPAKGNIAIFAGIPAAMAALFFAGYFGGRMAADYWKASDGELAAVQPAPVSSGQITTVNDVPRIEPEVAEVAVPPADTDSDATEDPSAQGGPLVEQPAKPIVAANLDTSAAAAPAAVEKTLPKPVAPPKLTTPKPAEKAPVDPASAKAAVLIGDGHKLMAAGDLTGARVLFTRAMRLGLPEAALALGRSYDPEYLARIPGSNAAPDAQMAGKMYRQWYEQSVEAGAISKDVQLDKLLQAMNAQ